MTLLYTLTVGGVLWGVALYWTYPRTAMGQAGAAVYGAVFLFVASVAVLGARRRVLALEGPGKVAGRGSLGSLLAANLVGAALIGLLGVVFGVLEVGKSIASAWIFGGMLAVLVFPLAWGVAHLRRGRAEPGALPAAAPRDLFVALLPMLAPFTALLSLLLLPSNEWWSLRLVPAARAGVLFQVMLPLCLPTALLVAWGLDRTDGSRSGALERLVVGVATLLLLLAVFLLPRVLWAAHGSEPTLAPIVAEGDVEPPRSLLLRWLFPDLPTLRPFFVVERAADGTAHASRLPLDSLFRGTAAMMLASGLLSAYALRRLGRGIRVLAARHVGALLAGQLLATAWALPRLGLQASPWVAAAGASLLFLWVVLMTRPAAARVD